MKTLRKILLSLVEIGLGFFIVTFIIYFFNLDMKLTAALEPTISKLQEKAKRDVHL